MEIKGIFFDLYGTLLIYGNMTAAWSDWLSAFYEGLKNNGLSMSKASVAPYFDNFFGRPAPPPQNDGLTIFERRIQALGLSLGLNLGTIEIQKIATACISAWHEYVFLDPEALPVLQSLKSKKSLGLISNFDHPPHVNLLLSELGLKKFFDVTIISGAVGVKKPDPRIFSLALEQIGLQPREVVYVGDNLKDDIQGAHAAGISPILIQRDRSRESKVLLDFKSNQLPLKNKATTVKESNVQIITKLSDLFIIS